ncbi:MAG: hypothetical protein P8Q95_07435 [Candidatus Poseidoniaceae archaeon]|nr:hypothetical protein [Candidatus Poseidoniaceae archaeon]|tara:strand:+ start:280 stop:468 length:189 start_codon:yes stop_codon:yes gene_type:complete
MTDIEILRMAAIAAVISILNEQSDDPSQVGRMPGTSWSQDHRRMNMGKTSLMNLRASRSPWK